ncbi:MAG: aminotransferase class V-fold PLP-dependent enzyme [Actinomycetota bacterium]|nr:aminotransferase class V-fold PLP-dependent enzyme [Actinomycetota bacterium]
MPDPRNLPDMPALMIAGPGELHEEDLGVVGRQMIAHYGDVWVGIHNDLVDRVGELMGSADRPYLMPGTGTLGLDSAVANLFTEGDRVVVPNAGFFGIRLMEVARAHRLKVDEVAVEVGAPVDPEAIAARVEGAAGVLMVHVETATGIRHPIEEVAKVANAAGALFMVDGIASVGGELVNVDRDGIDALVTGTQKGLEAPPGLGIVALGPRGRERVDSHEPPHSWYLDLRRWDWYRSEWTHHPHPVTMPTNLFLALASSVDRILEAGLEAWVGRRAALAKKLRQDLQDLGLELVAPAGYEANLVTAIYVDDPPSVVKGLIADNGIQISGGLEPLATDVVRIGLMGRTATEEWVDRVVAGMKAALA